MQKWQAKNLHLPKGTIKLPKTPLRIASTVSKKSTKKKWDTPIIETTENIEGLSKVEDKF